MLRDNQDDYNAKLSVTASPLRGFTYACQILQFVLSFRVPVPESGMHREEESIDTPEHVMGAFFHATRGQTHNSVPPSQPRAEHPPAAEPPSKAWLVFTADLRPCVTVWCCDRQAHRDPLRNTHTHRDITMHTSRTHTHAHAHTRTLVKALPVIKANATD